MTPTIKIIAPTKAETLCRRISANLPDYFGLPECNESYAQGVHQCVNFVAVVDDQEVGMLSLSFPYPTNSMIYWMGILKNYHRQGLGQLLLQHATLYAKQQQARTMTVETLSLTESDENYRNTYHFYEAQGFSPLFDLKPQGYAWNMVYLSKQLDNALHDLIAVEKDARQFGFEWPNEEMIIEQAVSECDEIREAIAQQEPSHRIEEEIGDLLHTAISLGLFAGFDPEKTLAKITEKFATRMSALKEAAREQGFNNLKNQPIDLLMDLWQIAKAKTKGHRLT